MAKKAWQKVDPSKMTNEQLAAAAGDLRAQIDQLNQEVGPLTQALQSVTAEISNQFNLQYPGLPPYGQLPPYPADFVGEYTFTAKVADNTPDA